MNARRSAAALAVPAAAGLALGLTMPRGPLVSWQSVVALVVAAAAGAVCGWLLRSRRAALLAPLVLIGVVELVRIAEGGPTVDRLRLSTVFEVGAFITGRGFDALVILLPMATGALWGAWWARCGAAQAARGPAEPASAEPPVRRSVRSRVGLGVRRVGLGLATAVVVLVAAGLVRPSSTEPILGADGEPLAGSVAELVTVPIGGQDQTIMLRGHDADAPVLLFLEGGPGGTALGSMRYAGEPLEESFVVATWDQRGTGTSVAAREPLDTFTVPQMVDDAVEVMEYLTDRFGTDGVYVVGSSWGTTLGVLAAQERPDLVLAYVGCGQMVDQFETDTIMYQESLDYARDAGDTGFEQQLESLGPPPYDDALDYPIALSSNPRWQDFTPGADHEWRASYPVSVFVGEYTMTQQVRALGAIMDTFAVLYPQLEDIDFRRTVPTLDVPVYLVEGQYEALGRSRLALEWYGMLSAPHKELAVWDHSGHTPHLDEPGRFADFMRTVLAETQQG